MIDQETIPLGKNTLYKTSYDPSLLFPIARVMGRAKIGLSNVSAKDLPFKGYDVWNCYEVSWLSESGKPEVRVLEFFVPHDSTYIVESKSVKLYFYSFNNTRFPNDQELNELIAQDLSNATNSNVIVKMHKLRELDKAPLGNFNGIELDKIEINLDEYEVNSNLLKLAADNDSVEEVLYSDLLRSNCLITNQPDWASIKISYLGKKIDHQSLLAYIVSFRNHTEFHEQCVERIFTDIMRLCNPTKLVVHAKYTRRGGIDINPIRSNDVVNITDIDNSRLIRQ